MDEKPQVPPPEMQVRRGPKNLVQFDPDAGSWHFISPAKGLEFPDPRWKAPKDAKLANRANRAMIRMHYGTFTTKDLDLARALYADYNASIKAGKVPAYRPSARPKPQGKPSHVTGSASVTNLKGAAPPKEPPGDPDGKAPAPPKGGK